jgi:hypothetical protein
LPTSSIVGRVLVTRGNPVFARPLWFSPDNTRVAVTADWTAPPGAEADRNEAYVVHLDGSTQTPRRVGQAPASCTGSCNAEVLQWSADGTALYIMGDLVTANDVEIYRVDLNEDWRSGVRVMRRMRVT